MITDLLAATILGLLVAGAGVAARFAWQRTVAGFVVAALLGAEVVLLGLLFVGLASTVFVAEPWLDVALRPLFIPVLGLLLAAGAVGGLSWLLSRIHGDTRRSGAAALLGLGLVLAVGTLALGIRLDQQEPPPTAEGERRLTEYPRQVPALTLPRGFVLREVVPPQTLRNPTAFVRSPDGTLYVATADGIVALSDTDGDGTLDLLRPFAPEVSPAFGLAVFQDALYAASAGSLLRLRDTDGDGRADSTEALVEGLPHFVYAFHSNNGLTFGPDGKPYMTVGGTSDHGPEEHRWGGTILRIEPDGTEAAVHARGFRNPYDLAFCPDGRLFATDNGPDQLDAELLYRPADEVNLVQAGADYGYPDFYGYPPPWSQSEAPVALLPLSSAATGITCHSGASFPPTYRHNLFVTLWGSLAIPEETGKKVVRVTLEEQAGQTVGKVSDFLTELDHPIDVVEDTDGSLLILDHGRGLIYQVSYAAEG
ncbi:MAG: hypothetical protein CL878_03265 [Dehalococcoidia bacterium]|nr:hypothetical protein [Dehalococcoidia bacterium]